MRCRLMSLKRLSFCGMPLPNETPVFFLREHFPGAEVEIPYRVRMKDVPIDEMSLTVRSSNGLMRAGTKTFGALHELMLMENGLRAVRNLGQKSEQEILHYFFNACYAMLRPGEQVVLAESA